MKEMDMMQQVYSFLLSHLDLEKRETIEMDYPMKIGAHYRSDIYLRNGCASLKIPHDTAIEIKGRLLPDTLYNLLEIYRRYKGKSELSSFIVLYDDGRGFSPKLLHHFQQYENIGFVVKTISDFCGDYKIPEKPTTITKEKWEQRRDRLLEDAYFAFHENHNTLFLGAGLGVDVNMPKWAELLGDLLNEAQSSSGSHIDRKDYGVIDESCNHSSLILGRYIEHGFKDVNEFKQKMHDSLYKNNPKPDSDLYEEIVEMILTKHVDQAITFNYDDLVETALSDKDFPYQSIFNRMHYSGIAFPIYHVHGMIPQTREIESTPVLSEKEYHSLYKESFHWSNVIQLQALSRTTCFFIGLSMNDPNLRRLLDISSNGLVGSDNSLIDRPCHYAFLERKPLNPQSPDKDQDQEHFDLQETMMAEFGINILWFGHNQFGEIPQMLRYIRTKRWE